MRRQRAAAAALLLALAAGGPGRAAGQCPLPAELPADTVLDPDPLFPDSCRDTVPSGGTCAIACAAGTWQDPGPAYS